MKKYILALALIGMSSQALIADTIVSSKTTIKKIYTYRTGAVLELTDPMASNSGCTYSKSGRYVALRYDSTTKELYSAILSAYVANLKVEIGTNGCDDIWSAVGSMNSVYKLNLTK